MNQEPGLDRSTITGIILITLIMGVWMVYFQPQPPPPTGDASAADSVRVEADPGPAEIREDRVAAAPLDSAFATATSGDERLITVQTDLYRAQFSTKGATLRSFVLSDYNKAGETEEAVDLVASEDGALALAFTPPQGRYIDSRALYFDTPELSGGALDVTDGPETLVFDVVLPGGTLRQTYTFTPGEYEIGLQIEELGGDLLSSSGGYELVWDGGIPFAEASASLEAAASGAYARSGGEVEQVNLVKEPSESQRLNGAVDWVAVKDKYFIAAIIPDGSTEGAELEGERFGEAGDLDFAEDFAVRLLMPRPRGEADGYRLYLGPMEFERIGAYDLDLYDVVDYGFGAFITRPIAKFIISPSFRFLGGLLPNYGLVIILFAFLVKMLLYPLTKVAYKNTARMRELQPKLDVVKEKYGDDPQKQQEAMMKVYRETGVNPLAGCLPMLLQYPIIIALWRYFQNSIVIRQESFLWANDLSAPDPILNLPFSIPLYGDFVAGFTLLMGLSMIVQMKVSMSGSTAMGGQQKVIMYMMPLMFFVFFNRFPSGLSLYYLGFNFLSIIQQRLVNKQVHDAAVNGPAEPKTNGKASSNGKAKAGKPSMAGKKRKKNSGSFTSSVIADAKRARDRKNQK